MSDAGSGKLQVAAAVRDCDRRRLLFYAPGAFAAISLVGFLSFDLGYTLLIASFGASAVILSHNHPSGVALPSPEDYTTTDRAKEALATIGVELADHIIVADGDFVSMADSGYLG